MATNNRNDENCCCCEVATDLTLAAWESWSGCLAPESTHDEAAEMIAAMYAKIYPVVAGLCTCGCGPARE
jgi:hypothetical protein